MMSQYSKFLVVRICAYVHMYICTYESVYTPEKHQRTKIDNVLYPTPFRTDLVEDAVPAKSAAFMSWSLRNEADWYRWSTPENSVFVYVNADKE